jgi:hypothetical protein
MKFSDFFNFSIVFRIVLEIGLLILPTKLILWLFYKMEFKK